MANIATSKQTGGGGFHFEDKVTAYFLTKLLTNQFALDSSLGTLLKIEFQVRPDGWLLDDLLLSFQNGVAEHKVAVSAKSNRQITANGLPADVLHDIWSQYLNINHELFDQNNDYFLFVVAPLGRSVSTNLATLIKSAQLTDAQVMAGRMATTNFSAAEKKLFNSFVCPRSVDTDSQLSDADTCRLLSRIIVLELDFQATTSVTELQLISELTTVLRSKSKSEAIKLYQRLCGIRPEIAPHGGFIDYHRLLSKLIGEFELEGYPIYDSDWKKIIQMTDTKIANVPDKIGGRFTINRSKEVDRLNEIFKKKRFVFLTGKSGFGKTVVAKYTAVKRLSNNSKVIWIDADLLHYASLKDAVNLTYDIAELISSAVTPDNLIIVDGADRFFKDNLIDHLTPLIRQVSELEQASWKILITCQSEDYENLLKSLYRKNLPALESETIEINRISKTELLRVASEFPQLLNLVMHDHLSGLLSNLKYLDMITYHISNFGMLQSGDQIGESSLIDWIWQNEISDNGDHGAANSRFLQELAAKQANLLTMYTPITEFRIEESGPISELKRMKLVAETNDKLHFIHDLFGDWARYKTIRSNEETIQAFLLSLDLASPLWGKAIRLYGVYLLEKKQDTSGWLTLFRGLSMNDPKQKLIRMLLLEAIIFSNNTFQFLEDLWDEMKQGDGEIINQFFEQFLAKATAPDPAVLKLVDSIPGITVSELATNYRTPIYNYWFPVLKFIKTHAVDLLSISRRNCVKIITYWLENVPKGSDFRHDMAQLALNLGQWLIDQKKSGTYVYREPSKEIYRLMLKSFSEFPDEVTDLALKLSGRKELSKDQELNDSGSRSYPFHNIGVEYVETNLGPVHTVDDDFRIACLNDADLSEIMIENPKAATEILLALLIKQRGERERSTNPTYGLEDMHDWFPPFYTRGPFMSFLNANPNAGLLLVIELTDLATKNWKKQRKNPKELHAISIGLADGTQQKYWGDNTVYFWFRDVGNAPHCLVSALMALEKYFINQLDNEKNIVPFLELLLNQSKSVAILGILSSVGRYKPDLFTGVLKPLLAQFDIYQWEMMLPYSSVVEQHQLIGAELLGITLAKKSIEWNKMPHRRKSIQQLAQLLFFNNPQIRNFFELSVIPQWISLRNAIEQQGYLEPYLDNLIGQFNIDNYVTVESEDYIRLEYREPESITQKLKEVRKQSDDDRDMDTFAFSISQELEKGKAFSSEEIDEIWHQVQQQTNRPDGRFNEIVNNRKSNIFACVAVIILNRASFKELNSNHYEWAVTQLLEEADRITYDYPNMEVMPLKQSPDSFKSIAIPRIYKQMPDDERIRRIVGIFTLTSSYPIISSFFGNLGKEFSWDDPLFVEIQNLYIERCHLIHDLDFNAWDTSGIDFEKILKPAFESFMKGDMKKVMTDLAIYQSAKEDQKFHQKRRHGVFYSVYKNPRLDVHALYKAFVQLPQLTEAGNTANDTFILAFYRSLIKLLTCTWGEITDDRLPLDEYVTEFDRWFAIRLSMLLPCISDLEQGKAYWEPLMSYGNLNHRWLEEFTMQLVYVNMDSERTEILGLHWNAMIDYAFRQKTWSNDERFQNGASLWNSLLGLSKVGLEIWRLGHVSLIATVKNQLLKWFKIQLASADETEKLCRLLKCPCGHIFLDPGLHYVNLHLKYQARLGETKVPEGFVRIPFKYNDTVAAMCSYIWEQNKFGITNNQQLFESFKEIVIHLVSIQNPTGLELQERMISI